MLTQAFILVASSFNSSQLSLHVQGAGITF